MIIFATMSKKKNNEANVSKEVIISKIYLIRGHKVMLDSDLAELYGVENKRLNEQVKRNQARFPDDFMFTLTTEEWQNLKPTRRGRKMRHQTVGAAEESYRMYLLSTAY